MSGPFGSSSFNHLISSGFYNGAISRSLRLDDGSNPELNLTDGKHPNPKGVNLISKNLEKKLIKLLNN